MLFRSEVFEEFAEQRQKSFLAMKGLKDQGVPVVGAYCTYFPAEIARAMGAVTVGLCSVSDETIPDAEKDLPKNLCPLIKSSYGFAKTDKCPFFYFSDVVVGETTCDGKKKMYEYMSDFKDVFVMELPNTQSEMALKLWKSELIRFKEYLEKKFDVEITDEAVLEAVKEEKPDGLVLGEVWEDASSKEAYGQRKNYFEGDKLDSVTNYPFKNGIIQLVRNGDPGELSEKVSTLCQNYPPEVMNCTMNILDSHDTTRILTALAGEIPPNEGDRDWMASAHLSPEEKERGRNLLKIASAIQMTLPGVPCIYYGDERGMEGYSDPFNRATVNWDKADQNLLEWYKKIISIRKNHQVYVSGKCETVAESAGLYAFRRFFPDNYDPENNQQSVDRGALEKTSEEGNRRSVITAANCGQSVESMSLTGRWKDLITGKVLTGRTDVLPGEILILEEQPGTLGTAIKKTGPRKISNYCHI